MKYLIPILILFLASCTGQIVKVSYVIDGDTFVTSKGETIRLAGIDCPEMKTEKGKRAKEFIEKLIEGENVYIERQGKGYYGRTIATVRKEGERVSKKLLRANLAEKYN